MHGVRFLRASPLLFSGQRTSPGVVAVHRSLSGAVWNGRSCDGNVRFYSNTRRNQLPVTFTKPSTEAAFEVVPTCPEATCECAATPKLPKPIDYKTNIRESAPGYIQHIVISTGRSDWSSRIEDEGKQEGEKIAPESPTVKERFKGLVRSFRSPGWTRGADAPREVGLARGLKAGLGRHGPHFDPMRPMLVTNASFPPPSASRRGPDSNSEAAAFLFPAFTYVTGIPDTPAGHEAFLQAFLSRDSESKASTPWRTIPISTPTILICSHGTRDARCGVLGPLLHAEFRRQLARVGIASDSDSESRGISGGGERRLGDSSAPGNWKSANVGMVSHVGGHKWAGNVIVYMPPLPSAAPDPAGRTGSTGLAGKGIWYGRVEPRHVEGIVQETVLRGRVIEELCRGVRG